LRIQVVVAGVIGGNTGINDDDHPLSVALDLLSEVFESTEGLSVDREVFVILHVWDIDSSNYYLDAQEKNVLIKSSINPEGEFEGALTAKVWPDHTVFLDFWADDAKKIWADGLKDLYDKVPYDGLWLDMNEATLFCNGECPETVPNYTKPEPSA
jgi:hypothetical protein